MSLDPEYFEYPKRREGYDHDLYTWSPMRERAPLTWPGAKPLAVWITVSLEWFPIIAEDQPFKAQGHMQTAYPDFRHYTSREYGTRVGIYRLLDAFAAAGIKVSVAANGAIADRYPQLVRDIVDAGHEIIAHSTDMNGTIASTLPEDDERALIASSVASLEKVTGIKPQGWLSIDRSQSWNTPRLLAEAGLSYCCDWANDELPYDFAHGLVNIPLNHELSDRQILNVQQHSADSYAVQIGDAADWLAAEAAREGGGRMLPLHITPYITGLPYRIDVFEQLVASLQARGDCWFARGIDLYHQFKEQS